MRIEWARIMVVGAQATTLLSKAFEVVTDHQTGAIIKVAGRGTDKANWISSRTNAPWQPLGSLWGLGYADLGGDLLHRYRWTSPEISQHKSGLTITYRGGALKLTVTRSFDDETSTFSEHYNFTNMGDTSLQLASRGKEAVAIYTPFNDHYTNTSDALENRSHAHVWANGGSNAWVKLTRMGGKHDNLGLVLTEGSLAGYSIESRDPVTQSNTRGVFLLHPVIPELTPGHSTIVSWTFFWHSDWEDFFRKCAIFSPQFIRFDVSNYTLTHGEKTTIKMRGAVNPETRINGALCEFKNDACEYTFTGNGLGQKALSVTTPYDDGPHNSTIYLNIVPHPDELIASRTRFILEKQQIEAPESNTHGAYALFDNQANVQVSWDTNADRNLGRERVGMGILMARWLKNHPDDRNVRESLEKYYSFVSLVLQDEDGFVYDGPTKADRDRGIRLYNWPWVLQLHLVMASLGLQLTGPVAEKTPIERFMLTLENFYKNGGGELYAIGLPVLESLRFLYDSGNQPALERAKSLYIKHGEFIVRRGLDYPPFEVNFEQSIVAPAAIITLELYRFTGNKTWLQAGELQLDTLLRFEGKQPDYRLHNVAIRHWDGYWFGKDRHWGDTFPHYWSTLNSVAYHHYGKATENKEFLVHADSIIRANLALFDPDGQAGCAWLYPITVNGRATHYRDPYANDQDWALNHLLYLEEDGKASLVV